MCRRGVKRRSLMLQLQKGKINLKKKKKKKVFQSRVDYSILEYVFIYLYVIRAMSFFESVLFSLFFDVTFFLNKFLILYIYVLMYLFCHIVLTTKPFRVRQGKSTRLFPSVISIYY